MKKKVLIWMTSMHLGGVERALIGLLDSFDYDNYQVDLFLNRHEGDCFKQIPDKVNILPPEPHYESLAEPMLKTLRRGQIGILACRVVAKILSIIRDGANNKDAGISMDYSHKFTKWLMPRINNDIEYDLAISFLMPHYFVAEKVKAKKRVAWVHTDYSQISVDVNAQLKILKKYNHIATVSEGVAKSFIDLFPSLKDKVVVVENILPKEMIVRQSKEAVSDFDPGIGFNLLSVGRFSYPKNFENIPIICKYILDKGLYVRWYIIGYGIYEKVIRQMIQDNKMEETVIILGKKSNPYPYIRNCDLYVQPSRYEGKAVTVREAQLLGKPVVITDFPTASSQLNDGKDGIIVPLDNKECADEIAKLIMDKSMLSSLADYCSNHDYSGKDEINKIYIMIE